MARTQAVFYRDARGTIGVWLDRHPLTDRSAYRLAVGPSLTGRGGVDVVSPAFSIGLREGLEACVVVVAMCTLVRSASVPDPLRRFGWVIAAALAVGLGSGVVLLRAMSGVSDGTMLRLEFGIGAVAALVLGSGFVSVGRRLAGESVVPLPRSGWLPVEIVVCALAIWRESVEATLFVASSERSGAGGTGGAVAHVLAGTLAAVLATVLGAGVLRTGLSARQVLAVTQGLLGLFAAGMTMNAVRSAASLGWFEPGGGRLAMLGWLDAPGAQVVRSLAGLVGLVPGMSVSEGAAWMALVVTVGVSVGRSWRTAT